MVRTEEKLSTFEVGIQKQLDHFMEAEVCEASVERAMSAEQFDSKFILKNIAIKETLLQQIDILVDVRNSFIGIRQEIAIFEESKETSNNVLQKMKEKMGLAANKLLTLEDSIKKQFNHFVYAEVCEAAVKGTTSAEQFDSKNMLKNVATKKKIQQQNDLLLYVRASFSIIRLKIVIFEDFLKKSLDKLLKVIEQVVPAEKKLLTLTVGIQKQLAYFVVAEICEAAVEGAMSAEQFDSEVVLKKVAFKETVEQQNDTLVDVCTSFIRIRQEITIFEESKEILINVLQKMKEKMGLAENKLLTLADSIQKQLDQLVETKSGEAVIAMGLSDVKAIKHSLKDD